MPSSDALNFSCIGWFTVATIGPSPCSSIFGVSLSANYQNEHWNIYISLSMDANIYGSSLQLCFCVGDDGHFSIIKRYLTCCSIFRLRSCLLTSRRLCKSFVSSREEVEYTRLWGWCSSTSIYGGVTFFFRKLVNEEWYKVRMRKVPMRIANIIVKQRGAFVHWPCKKNYCSISLSFLNNKIIFFSMTFYFYLKCLTIMTLYQCMWTICIMFSIQAHIPVIHYYTQ